jgi:DNA-binding MarR family transcriptional regulator
MLNNHGRDTKEIAVLEGIYLSSRESGVSPKQREIARQSGISLGMANSILKRIAKKGWVMVHRLNGRNIHYAVTRQGMKQIARRSYQYVHRTLRSIAKYRESISRLVRNAKSAGFTGIQLVGQSDLDFIIEHECRLHRMEYDHAKENAKRRHFFQIVAEDHVVLPSAHQRSEKSDAAFLLPILAEPAAGARDG